MTKKEDKMSLNNHEMAHEELVSIIMPSYNSEKFILDSIHSVQQQTYENWELLIVDDCSTDGTVALIENEVLNDSRIQLEVLSQNSGAAIARNTAIKEAKGVYLAFLDSDDLWEKDKLTKQINFMEMNQYLFTSTSFEEVNEENQLIDHIVKSHKQLDYEGVLKYCPGNSTVIYNMKELGKFYIPDIKKRNDFVMWLQVIKKAEHLHGLEEVLSLYRVREGSLSKDKIDLVKYQWNVYRKIEGLPFFKSLYLLLHKTVSVLSK